MIFSSEIFWIEASLHMLSEALDYPQIYLFLDFLINRQNPIVYLAEV